MTTITFSLNGKQITTDETTYDQAWTKYVRAVHLVRDPREFDMERRAAAVIAAKSERTIYDEQFLSAWEQFARELGV